MDTPPEYIAGSTALAANDVCRACGLCCDGTFFDKVPVTETEMKEVDFQIHKRKGAKLGFHQPCTGLVDGSCSIYTHRPATCRDYSCKIQKQVMNGSLSQEFALDIVSSVKTLTSELADWARLNTRKEVKLISLSGFLRWYLKKIRKLDGTNSISAVDKEHILKAFEFLKLRDRYFQTSKLLTGFADIIQSFPRDELAPPHTQIPTDSI